MTKKDYELIARSISRTWHAVGTSDHESAAIQLAAQHLADALADANPNFDRYKFLKACLP